ncbi:MAG TPA: CHAT domain-containing protein [Pyrinomonadaceae bacterium]
MQPDVTLNRTVKEKATDTFTFDLAANQYARLIITPNGINLFVKIVASDPSLPVKYENHTGLRTPLFISIVTTVRSTYTVEVRARDNCLLLGEYSIRLDQPHNPTPIEEKQALATSLIVEGNRKQLATDDQARREALEKYEAAVKLWQEIGDDFELANAFQQMGRTYAKLRNLSAAVERYNLALDLHKNNEPAVAYTLLDLAEAYYVNRDRATALSKYDDALKAFREAGDRIGEILAQAGIGIIYMDQNRWQEALEVQQSVRELSRNEGNRCGEMRAFNALGGVYDNLLRPDEAMHSYQAALDGWHKLGDLRQEGNTFNNIGLLYDSWGQWNEAFTSYKNALDLLDQAQKQPEANLDDIRRKRASLLLNLGALYVGLGDYETGLGVLKESLSHRDPGGAGRTLMWLGYSHALKGDSAEALKYCELALEQLDKDSGPAAETYTVMGMAYLEKDQALRAIDYFKKALEIQQNPKQPDLKAQAITLDKLGRAYLASGDLGSARQELERARSLWHNFRDSNGEAMSLGQLARVESAAGNLELAVRHVEHAIRLVEPLRTNLFNQQLRASYYADKVDYFELLTDLHMRLEKSGSQGAHVVAAFEAGERQRARSLLDILDANIDPGKLTDRKLAELIHKRRSLQRTIILNSARQSELRQFLLKFKTKPSENSGNQTAETEHKLFALDRELTQLISERQHVEQTIKSDFRRYSALMAPEPLSAEQIKSLLDDDTLLLQFSLGQERSYLWLVTPDDVSGFPLSGRAAIEEKAQNLINALRNSEPRRGESAAALRARRARELPAYLSEATKLSQMLFGRVADRLNKKRLVIVADGALLHLPFSALPMPRGTSDNGSTVASTPLVLAHEIVNLPSASALQLLRQTTRPKKFPLTVAVFSDPVFERDDTRIPILGRRNQASQPSSNNSLSRLLRDFEELGSNPPRLQATAVEAQAILQFAPRATARLESGFRANRKNLADKQLAQYRIVHLATHAMIDEHNPELSGIVLSLYDQQGQFHQEGYLRLTDIYELNLPIDLVVLSACRTALGKRVRGEGLISLTRAFMFAGASRVIASLWRVDDEVTAELMKRFYEGLLKDGLMPAEALKAAQISMWKDPRWHHPYFWSGFVLQGDWR